MVISRAATAWAESEIDLLIAIAHYDAASFSALYANSIQWREDVLGAGADPKGRTVMRTCTICESRRIGCAIRLGYGRAAGKWYESKNLAP